MDALEVSKTFLAYERLDAACVERLEVIVGRRREVAEEGESSEADWIEGRQPRYQLVRMDA